jgi:hypothetical protein
MQYLKNVNFAAFSGWQRRYLSIKKTFYNHVFMLEPFLGIVPFSETFSKYPRRPRRVKGGNGSMRVLPSGHYLNY